ncbi:uncharacterized protein LOC108086293 [Drosophila ficusphila]|uniref:uncharacterized protein LOC108086293 n=1 Tax=Drosophila ficusphila TaxID=30025 RepID=UPI0007E7E73F|nr:uncharacterized protein LOC108086293 [Drosophila ficusphila]
MLKLFHPILKWVCLCCVAAVLILSLSSQTADTQYQRFNKAAKVSGLASSSESLDEEPVGSTTDCLPETDEVRPSFFVESARCKIPYVDPFEAEAMAIFEPQQFETCSNESALVTPIYDVSRQRYLLVINETLASEKLNDSEAEFNCYYQEIRRDRQHDSYKKMERKYFSQSYEVPLHVRGLMVACHRLGNESDVLQADAYSLVQYLSPPPPGLSLEPAKRKPSVIMFGIDSLSRINLRRTMPRVSRFLAGSGWYELQGYNKIGDNTFPNLMAILTGYSKESAQKKVCDWQKKGCLDKMPLLWKDFRNASYLTAFAEDEPHIETFNYMRPGFVEQPTDFYLRPHLKAFESGMDTWKCRNCSSKYCIGRRITSSYVYDLARDFARRFVDERPVWGLFWSNSFSHDSFQMPSKMDDYVLQYLLDFEADGVLEQSIVVFLSDHGSRFGRLTALSSGFLEERLPAMFLYLPPWFRDQYPDYARALQLNRNRLTSNYDLHNTLKHIIELGGTPDGAALPRAADCPKCQSLFLPVDESRSCEDAGIPVHFCTCVPFKRLRTQWARRIAPLVVRRINEYLAGRNLSNICAELTLKYIHETEIQIGLDQSFDDVPVAEVATYRTMFKVHQNTADFRATVVFNNLTESVEVQVPTISRLDRYEKVSTCVDDKTDKLYCLCKRDLKDEHSR